MIMIKVENEDYELMKSKLKFQTNLSLKRKIFTFHTFNCYYLTDES